jgi:hypothetical protein
MLNLGEKLEGAPKKRRRPAARKKIMHSHPPREMNSGADSMSPGGAGSESHKNKR